MEPTASSFRDRPVNIDEQGIRRRIHAKQPKGKWYVRRTLFAWACIAFLVLAPIVTIHGNPLMLLDIANRKFSLFGQIIWAQDTFLLALIMLVTVVFVVLFTAVFGRVWCGWACPQTIFLEMIYRRIEYLFDTKNPKNYVHNSRFTLRNIAKHSAFILVSVFFTNVFLMWFIGPQQLLETMAAPIKQHQVGFMFMLAVSLFYYWIYTSLREQVCTLFCPYGRLQSVLLDAKSLTVIYDFKRGEPRGAKGGGDCVNCGQCIAVCPTGIDIKNGTQLECTNCTACIDACNTVMKRVKRPANLIRFDSYKGIESGKKSLANARTYAYSAVLAVLVLILGFTVATRSPIEVSMLRMPGTMYQTVDSVTVSNLYNVRLINKSGGVMCLTYKLLNPVKGKLQFTADVSNIGSNKSAEGVLILTMPSAMLKGKSTQLSIGIFEGSTCLITQQINFIGP